MKKQNKIVFFALIFTILLAACKKEQQRNVLKTTNKKTNISFTVSDKSSKNILNYYCTIIKYGHGRPCPFGIYFEVYKNIFKVNEKNSIEIELPFTTIDQSAESYGDSNCPSNPQSFIVFSTDSTVLLKKPGDKYYYLSSSESLDETKYKADINVNSKIIPGTNNYFIAEFKD
jgi:hypothetical protein